MTARLTGPRPIRRKLAFAGAILLVLGCCSLGMLRAQAKAWEADFLADFWRSEQVAAAFAASYGFQGEREPSVSAEERNLLRRLAGLIPQSPADAARLLERSIRPDSSAALDFTLGNLQFQLDRLDQARQNYENALAKFPGFLRAHKNLAMVRVQQESYEPALKSLTRVLEMGGADGVAYGLIGYAHLQLDRPLSAEPAYRQALLFDAENLNWKLGLARCLQLQERQREAAALFGELISRQPERPEHWLFQANAFMALDETRRAAQNIELVRRMNAASPEALLMLGDIYLNDDLVDLAVDVYEQALAEAPERAAPRALRAAEALGQRDRPVEARRLLAAVQEIEVELSPRDSLRRQRLHARLALAEGNHSEAVTVLEEALTDFPLDGSSLLLLGRAHAMTGETERAELAFQRAAEVPGFRAASLRQHGELLVTERRFDEALDHLRQAQTLEPRRHVERYIEQVERLARLSKAAK